MNLNTIRVDGFSNPESEQLYRQAWPDDPELRIQATEDCLQCGGCSFFSPFNDDWGLCCNEASRHHLETVFEHFSCASIAYEGWGAHSFCNDERYFCRCDGYTPLPPDTELICLSVNMENLGDEKVRATLEVNDRLAVEDNSLYFALLTLKKRVERALMKRNRRDV